MRNGNYGYRLPSGSRNTVLTVPMRNGNVSVTMNYISSYSVLTVPMRNGNFLRRWSNMKLLSSYRTYEEWKQSNMSWIIACSSACSYRTYEEWKPFPDTSRSIYAKVLTVPMRNGNLNLFASPFVVKPVLTVPMRNGNLCRSINITLSFTVLTVPMRNGNKYTYLDFLPM